MNLPTEYGYPIGFTYGTSNDIAFVTFGTNSTSVNIPHQTYLAVLDASDFTPSVLHVIHYPYAETGPQGAPHIALANRGDYLYTSAGYGAIVTNAERAIRKHPDAIVGYLNGSTATLLGGDDGFGVVVSGEERYVFVIMEQASANVTIGNVDVFALNPPACDGRVTGTSIGHIILDMAVTDGVLSPDDRYFYASSETAGIDSSHTSLLPGVIDVLDVGRLETDPSTALLTNATGDCGSTRLARSLTRARSCGSLTAAATR